MSEPEFLTVTEVALLLRVSERTVLRLIEKKKLVAVKVGRAWRIPREEFHNFLERAKKEEPPKRPSKKKEKPTEEEKKVSEEST